jgi:hypothetical protein
MGTQPNETIVAQCHDPSHWMRLLEESRSACQGQGQVEWPCEFRVFCHVQGDGGGGGGG